jgi:hypothetical protein
MCLFDMITTHVHCGLQNGTIFGCLPKDGVSVVETKPGALSKYTFGKRQFEHNFCGTCGVPTHVLNLGLTPEELAAMPEEERAKKIWGFAHTSVNLRALNGVEWEKLKIMKYSGKDLGPEYVVA